MLGKSGTGRIGHEPEALRRLDGRDPLLPAAQGLYRPDRESDSCGVGFVADMHNRATDRKSVV